MIDYILNGLIIFGLIVLGLVGLIIVGGIITLIMWILIDKIWGPVLDFLDDKFDIF